MTDPNPREVVCHQLGHLREGVDEDEIEEELERRHPLLSFGHRTVRHSLVLERLRSARSGPSSTVHPGS